MPLLGTPRRLNHLIDQQRGGNTRVSTPTDTKSDNRRSDSGLRQPVHEAYPTNYTHVVLTERYWT